MANDDTRTGAVLAVVSIAYLVGAIRLVADPLDAGPGLLPLALGLLLFTFAMITLARGRRSAANDAGNQISRREHARTSGLVVILTLLYVLAFYPLGFAASTMVYTFAMTFVFKGNSPSFLLTVPLLSTVAIYLFFRVALGARLPAGFFG